MKKLLLLTFLLGSIPVFAQQKNHIESLTMNYNLISNYNSSLQSLSMFEHIGEEYYYVEPYHSHVDFGTISLNFNYAAFENNNFVSLEIFPLELRYMSVNSSKENYSEEKISMLRNIKDIYSWRTKVGVNYYVKLLGSERKSGLFLQLSYHLGYKIIGQQGGSSHHLITNYYNSTGLGIYSRFNLSERLLLNLNYKLELLDFGFQCYRFDSPKMKTRVFVDELPGASIQIGCTYYFRPSNQKTSETGQNKAFKQKLHMLIDNMF